MVLTWPMTLERKCQDSLGGLDRQIDSLPVQIAIGEETSTASNGRPTALPATFLVIFQWFTMESDFVALWGTLYDILLRVMEELHVDSD